MDDAGGGLRGLRAAPTPALFDLVRGMYGIDCSEAPVDLGGSANLNLLFENGGDRRVVRVYRPHVTEARLSAIDAAREHLAASGIPCVRPEPATGGERWVRFGDRLVEVERYVEHDAKMDSWERVEAALPLLGRIHSCLRDLDVDDAGRTPMFANYVEPGEALVQTLRGTRRIRSWEGFAAPELAENAGELARTVSEAERSLAAGLPRQLTHGDFWDNNVLFEDGRIVCVGDFDFMGERTRVDDLALTLYFTCLEFVPAPTSDDQLQRLSRLLEAYDAGADEPLTAIERSALPLALARQPLWSIGGWVVSLDDDEAARRHAAAAASEVERGLSLMGEVGRWQEAFAR